MSKRVCSAPGCCRIAVDSKYCVEHQHLVARDREASRIYFAGVRHEWQELYNSAQWKNLSKKILNQNPVCQKCWSEPSTEIHHAIPHRGDKNLFYEESNLIALCHRCHTEETKKEVSGRRQKRNAKLWY